MIGKTVSHYKILERLGGGGMGVVFRAEDLKLGRSVALKFLPPELGQDEKRRKRFVQEAKAASSLDHPNLCTIYEIDQTEDGQMFIAMAVYEGETLKEKIRTGTTSVPTALDIATQMAEGLAIAHANGIVHRDIKPANVIVTKSGLVKILDFGLVKLADGSQITEAETAVGTISYMSPEQALGKLVDQRTDIWSWGIVLYEMLTGRLPFSAEIPVQLVQFLYSKEPVELGGVQLPSGIEPILQKALAKAPENRYSSILHANEELKNVKISSHSLTVTIASLKSIPEKTITGVGATFTPQKTEKKPLTFVVSGITGYTELLEQLPYEDVHQLLNRIQLCTVELAEKYHAVLNEFDPDRIVVLFGFPSAQENDFVTAVHFAFDLQKEVKKIARECGSPCDQLISLRVAVHSGLVLMQPSHRSKNQYEITGLPFQIALTLASNAKPSEVVIGHESRRLTRNLFVTESRDAVVVPGTSRSSSAYRLISQSDPSAESFLAPYTGRARELNILSNCWQKAKNGEGQFVALVGDAGVGKSRLFAEFKKSIDTKIRHLHGHCHPYGTSISYAPFRELVAAALSVQPTTSAEEVIQKIRELDPLLQDLIPLYLHLLSLQSEKFPFPKHLEGENLRLAILDALTAFVLVKKKGPVLVLIEDWHWADEASQNALKQIVEMVSEHSAMVVVSGRPDSSLEWIGGPYHTRIHLDPLESSTSRELMLSLLGSKKVSEKLAQLIFDRSGGNPFFLEEICLSLKEEGKIKLEEDTAVLIGSPQELRLPETIHALILSRLDRLDRETRKILQTASVIGREFTRSILLRATINDANLATCLSSLKGLGLIQQVQVLPEATYKFRHALTQGVAYDSLLAHEKKQIHQRVAEATEELYQDRLDEHLDILAEHYSRAECWAKAAEYGMRSSRKAVTLGQFSDALQILKKSERWLFKLPDDAWRRNTEIDLILQEERLCETLGIRDRQEQILEHLLEVLEKTDDKTRLMEVYRRYGELLTLMARFAAAEAALERSLKFSKTLGDRAGERNAYRSIGFMRWHQGRNEEAIENTHKALEIDRERGDREALAADLLNLSSVLRNQGNPKQALSSLEEALELYDQVNDPVKHAATFHTLGILQRELGNPQEAMHSLQAAMAISTRYRLVILQSFHITSLANMCWQEGKTEECLELQKQAVEINRKSRHADGLANSLRMVGETLQNLNRPLDALPYLEEAASIFERLKDLRNVGHICKKVVGIYEDNSRWDEALGCLGKLKNLYASQDSRKEFIETTQRMAEICRKKEDDPGAVGYYREAAEAQEENGDYPAVAALLNSIAILEWKVGNFAAALEDYQKALEIFQDHGDEVHSGLILNSIGLTLKSMGRLEEAESVLEKALLLNRKTGQRKLEGHTLSALADVQNALGRVDSAAEYYDEALRIKRETKDVRGEAWMLYHLARLQMLMNEESRNESYRIEADKMIKDSGDDKLKEAWIELQRNFETRTGGNHA
jgi:predicted ATPase/serine/threonine protein kinase